MRLLWRAALRRARVEECPRGPEPRRVRGRAPLRPRLRYDGGVRHARSRRLRLVWFSRRLRRPYVYPLSRLLLFRMSRRGERIGPRWLTFVRFSALPDCTLVKPLIIVKLRWCQASVLTQRWSTRAAIFANLGRAGRGIAPAHLNADAGR